MAKKKTLGHKIKTIEDADEFYDAIDPIRSLIAAKNARIAELERKLADAFDEIDEWESRCG